MGKFYKCDIKDCEKLFSSKFSLKRHNLIHLNSKKHKCKHCAKAFVLPQYLEEHEYTHTGAKPFLCGINGCQEQFRQRGKLSIHKKNAHPEFRNDNQKMGMENGGGIESQGMSQALKGRIIEDEEDKSDLLGMSHLNQSQQLPYGLKMQQPALNSSMMNSCNSKVLASQDPHNGSVESMLLAERTLFETFGGRNPMHSQLGISRLRERLTPEQIQSIMSQSNFNSLVQGDDNQIQHHNFSAPSAAAAGDFKSSVVSKIQSLQNNRVNRDSQNYQQPMQSISMVNSQMEQTRKQLPSQQYQQQQNFSSNEQLTQKYVQQQDPSFPFWNNMKDSQKIKSEQQQTSQPLKSIQQQILAQQMAKANNMADLMNNRTFQQLCGGGTNSQQLLTSGYTNSILNQQNYSCKLPPFDSCLVGQQINEEGLSGSSYEDLSDSEQIYR